jgi:membrane protein
MAKVDRDRPKPLDAAVKRGARWRAAPRRWSKLFADAGKEFWADRAPRMGASLAFYTILSLAPLLILAQPLVGAAFGAQTARDKIIDQFGQLAGEPGRLAVAQMLKPLPPDESAASQPWTTALSVAVLVFGATAVFAELQDALNVVWEVVPKPNQRVIWEFIRVRLLSFAMVMGICFLLLVSLLLGATLEALREYAQRVYGDPNATEAAAVWSWAHLLASLVVVTVLFAMIFKVLPDATVGWRDVWLGALLTSALFVAGRFLIGKYLGRSGISARYGAGGSLVALLVWVYYSAQILIYGAEFTKAYSRRTGRRVVATEVAVPITEEARAQQGIAHQDVVEAVKDVQERKREQ